MIFHIASALDVRNQISKATHYIADSLQIEGFIHCSTWQQVFDTLPRFFTGVQDLVLLYIDTSVLDSETLVFEDTVGVGQEFPHYYGAIPFSAILRVQTIPNDEVRRKDMVQLAVVDHELVDEAIALISKLASIPSFSSFEERIIPQIEQFCSEQNLSSEIVDKRNLLIRSNSSTHPKVAFTAHLDKINHFGEQSPQTVPFSVKGDKIVGLLDDSVGLALCLLVAKYSGQPTMVLFSEMEESTDLKHRPQLMRDGGEGLAHGMGAKKLAQWLNYFRIRPSVVITIDVTPKFADKPGVALYSRHWEYNAVVPSVDYIQKTEVLVRQVQHLDGEVEEHNNTNDYLTYGEMLHPRSVSVALEPAIHHYHTAHEEVFVSDLQRVLRLSLVLSDLYSSSLSSTITS